MFVRSIQVSRRWIAPVVALVSVALAAAEPPKVVRATPDNGDTVSAAEVTQLRIEFDQDMSSDGYSLCGGGPSFPKVKGKPKWENARTFVAKVALEAGKTYEFSVNCQAAGNFKGVSGESATPYAIRFTTAKQGDAPAAGLTPAQAGEMRDALRRAVATRYAYRDRVVKDWDKAFAEHDRALRGAKTATEFARAAAALLTAAQDPHLYLLAGETPIYPKLAAPPPLNYDFAIVRGLLSDVKVHGKNVAVGKLAGDVPYVMIGGWNYDDVENIDLAIAFLKEHKDAPGMVLDVRPNGGGDERLAMRVAGLFLDKACTYSKNKNIDPGAGAGFTKMFDRRVEPAPEAERVQARVAVLMGPRCMSSNESFLLMMRQSPRARLFGETSRGSSGNPKPVDIGGDVSVVLPSWQDYLPTGELLEGRGVTPDEPVKYAPKKGASDAVIDAALKWLAKR